MKKIKFKKKKLSKESLKKSIQEVNENEEFKKIRKREKTYFKKKILKTLREELDMMNKILEKPFQEHNSRFEKDQEVDKNFKWNLKSLRK